MTLKVLLPFLFSLFISIPHTSTAPETTDELWAEMSRTVSEGDFEAYAALYHEDAVLVNEIPENSIYAISEALDGWKPGFDDTKAGNMTAGVEFRFSQQIRSATSAHDTGIFHYYSQKHGEEKQSVYIHFEGLSVQKNGVWKLVMEYQKSMASPEEWEALKQ